MNDLAKLLTGISARAATHSAASSLAASSPVFNASAGAANYRNGIRAAVRGLWLGAFDFYQFYDALDVTIRNGLTTAWYEGAAECGILPADLSPTERAAIAQAIAGELGHIDSFATEIEAGSKANGGKVGPLLARAEMWILRYQDVVNRAKVMACADQKLEWVLGLTKEHCSTCLKLTGKVKRASYWQQVGVRPQSPPNPLLECGGWACLCNLIITDAPMSKGPLPNLP